MKRARVGEVSHVTVDALGLHVVLHVEGKERLLTSTEARRLADVLRSAAIQVTYGAGGAR